MRAAALHPSSADADRADSPVKVGESRTLEEAIGVRTARLGAWALNTQPAWVRGDVRRWVAETLGPIETTTLAGHYRAVAAYLDRAGRPLDASDIDQALGPRPAAPELAAQWTAVRAHAPTPAIGHGAAVDLGCILSRHCGDTRPLGIHRLRPTTQPASASSGHPGDAQCGRDRGGDPPGARPRRGGGGRGPCHEAGGAVAAAVEVGEWDWDAYERARR